MLLGLLNRALRIAAVSAFANLFGAWRSEAYAWTAYDLVWPPSRRSIPFMLLVCILFAIGVQETFFNVVENEENKRVRQVKKRLLLAQMTQALKWNVEDDNEDEEKDKPGDDGEKKQKKRPPSTKDLFEMLYDDVEERHVTEYDIPAGEEPYKGVFALFHERIVVDFEEAVKYTNLARGSLEDVDASLDAEDLKHIAEFRDGTKLQDLLDLYQKKIRKRFGRNIAPANVVKAAVACHAQLGLEQRKGIQKLLPMLVPLLPVYGIGTFLMIFDSVTGAALWHSLSAVLDGVDAGTMSMEELKWVTATNQVKFFFCIFAHMSSWAFTGKVTSQFRLKVRSQVMRCMVRQDTAFFDIFPSGVLQERLNNDAEKVASKIFDTPLRLIHNVCMLGSNLFVVYTLKPNLCLIIFAPLPIISIAQYFIIKYMDQIGERQQKIGEQSAAGTMEVLKEIRTVREFAMESEEAEKFAANSSYRADIEERGTALEHIFFLSPLICTMNAVRNVTTFLCGFHVVAHSLTVGQACQIAWAADHLQHCIRDIMFLTPDVLKVLTPLGRVCDMLDSKPKIEPRPGAPPKLKPDRFNGHIEFKDVDFTFPSEPNKQILFKLCFTVSPGEKVAFVGSTGCGKSTSLKLIERFYDPTSGTITLDGRNINEYDVHHLRQNMSVVAQDNVLFSTTLRENIIYGLPREKRECIGNDEIEDACRKANAMIFIQDFPRKFETYAGERGVKLSGGQKQRLAIARAVIRKPTIVLLDEATSALDSKAEGVVQEALDKMIEANATGCTIMIAHRLATVKKCDRIIVMDHGVIQEEGSHDNLLRIPIEKNGDGSMVTGWYHDLWDTQMGKADDAKRLETLELRIKELEAENLSLRAASKLSTVPISKQKMGHIRRPDAVPPPIQLSRCSSGGNAPSAPSQLSLERYQTAY